MTEKSRVQSSRTQNVVQTDGQENSRIRTSMFALAVSNFLLRRIWAIFWARYLGYYNIGSFWNNEVTVEHSLMTKWFKIRVQLFREDE